MPDPLYLVTIQLTIQLGSNLSSSLNEGIPFFFFNCLEGSHLMPWSELHRLQPIMYYRRAKKCPPEIEDEGPSKDATERWALYNLPSLWNP